MLFYAITGLINAIGSTFLGLLVYLKNKKANLNKIFAIFCLSVAGWAGLYFFFGKNRNRLKNYHLGKLKKP